MSDSQPPQIKVQFALPPPSLQPFVTTFYLCEVETGPEVDWIEDHLHPEWPNLRFHRPGSVQASIGGAPLDSTSCFTVSGPTSMATRFRMATGRSWGIGLLPLGWARLIGVPADDFADRHVDGEHEPAFAGFGTLAQSLISSDGDYDADLAIIIEQLLDLLSLPLREDPQINAINAALLDPNIASVSQLSEATDIGTRTLERLSRRFFGFTPKLLLRRQRFLRSMAQFMLDPTMKWLNALDFQYHDQAHFVRDFKRFMGMSPREYGKLQHPFLRAAAVVRSEIFGSAVQGLHDPRAKLPTV